ncbi:MAG: iron uptake protein [Bacteroidota bacterium]
MKRFFSSPAFGMVQRLVLALGGGYVLSASFVMLVGWGLAQLGMARGEAVVLSMMVGFLVFLGLILWAFAERTLVRLWVVFGGGSLVGIGLVQLVSASFAATP